MKEKKDRVDDALAATRAAVEEGIVPGGGVALIRCDSALEALKTANDDEEIGVDIVRKALGAPLYQIVDNAGGNGNVVVHFVKEGESSFGYNARTNEYGDMIEMGIVDPTKVTRTAVENAVSIASMILMTECVIVDEPSKDEMPMDPGMMM
jgi:chaperonin GroEL